MKFSCSCGATIIDASDYLPSKGHMIPDEEVYDVYDGMDDDIIEPVAQGKLSASDACTMQRLLYSKHERRMYQCYTCGRLYIADRNQKFHCFVPESDDTSRRILSSDPEKQ